MPRGQYDRSHLKGKKRKGPKKLSSAEAKKLRAAADKAATGQLAELPQTAEFFQKAETPWSQYIIILVTAEGKRTVDLTSNRLSLEETLQQVRVQNPAAEQWTVIRYNEMDFAQSVHRGR